MLSIEFHYRPSVRKDSDEGKVFLRLIYARQSGSITLPCSVRQAEWEVLYHRLRNPSLFSLSEEELFLLNEKKTLQVIAGELESMGTLNVPEILRVYRFRRQKKGLVALVEELSKELIRQGKERTARAYRTTLRMLQAYLGKKEIYPEELTVELLRRYEQYMRAEKKSLNTISFYMRNLRAIYNKGIKKGYFPFRHDMPFSGVYTKVAPTRKRALSKQELRLLENLLEDPVSPLEKEERNALSLFLFSFHSRGMCFVDLAHLQKKDIAGGMLHYYRRKTGQYMELKISPAMRKYMGLISAGQNSPYQFHIIHPERSAYVQYCTGLRRQNRLLNQIGRKAGLNQTLTTHMARHSWATVAKMEQIPVEVISEALGHTRLDTTYRYLGSFGESVLDKASRKVSKAIRTAV
ncbi:MAG: site-specific integrase [Tannerellaceae bacterium]|nr:site-specific integrase [Tannerellaceae bacterium]